MTTSHGDVYTFVYIFIYMGKELDSDFYNEVFKNGGSEGMYFLSYDQTPWVNVWNEIIDYIIDNGFTSVLDIGCGPGQFADFLKNRMPDIKYTGIDFSQTAIDMAKELVPSFDFIAADAVTFDYSSVNYDIVVTTEFLEHIKGDLRILNKIKRNTTILATQPNMDSDGHVRFYSKNIVTAEKQLIKRYGNICNINDIKYFPYELNPTNGDYLIKMVKL